MNGPDQNFGTQGQEFGNYTLTTSEDANIDPLLNPCTTTGPVPPNVSNAMDSQFLMSSAMWNPALNNPVDFYSPNMSGMASATLTNSPKPPTETQSSPRTTSNEPMFEGSRTSSKSSIPSVNSADTNIEPRRSSRGTKAQRQRPPREPISNPPRRRRATKEPSVKEEDVGENGDEDDEAGLDENTKRDKFLKRNRIAASKCRQKKKEWVNNLEETRYGLEHENSALHKQYNGLVDELSSIKTQLMQHASCNDANINQWLDTEAKRFVQRIAAQNRAPAPGQPHRDTGDCCDSHRRSSSVATSIPRSIESEINYDRMPDSMMNVGP
ncbi:hypothetical protein NW762_011254 [Fusarium torreyae]|uniref:BZIP domain-containing protein n=1 Tax=Fusarium torreyae TaxID=1237075 RepID=A0A9W8VCR4_9HYPO|nr:hypothetical protein NW762_011254 [Fusarium torreyae]